MVDIIVYRSTTAKDNTANSEHLRADIIKKTRKLVLKSAKNKKKRIWCEGCKERRRLQCRIC